VDFASENEYTGATWCALRSSRSHCLGTEFVTSHRDRDYICPMHFRPWEAPEPRRVGCALAAVALAAASAGAVVPRGVATGLSRYALTADAALQHDLPGRLEEVSGLAASADGRLFAHDDERARVYEVDPGSGKILKRIDVGPGGIRGDFEGIALAGQRFFLVESDGTLYEFEEGEEKETVEYEVHRTDLARRCEVEGLAWDARTDSLLLVCKTTRGRELRNHLVVFAFSLATMALEPEPRYQVPYAALRDVGARGQLHPSGIEVDRDTGHIFVVAAREEGLVEMDRSGVFVAAAELPHRLHRQPEGITVLNAELIIADEGSGRKATLTRYPEKEPGSEAGR